MAEGKYSYKRQVKTTLSPGMLSELNKYSKSKGVKEPEVMREALKEFLSKKKDKTPGNRIV